MLAGKNFHRSDNVGTFFAMARIDDGHEVGIISLEQLVSFVDAQRRLNGVYQAKDRRAGDARRGQRARNEQ